MTEQQPLHALIASRLDNVEEHRNGQWKGDCPVCLGKRSMLVAARGFSCGDCYTKDTDLLVLDKLCDERDRTATYLTGEDPFAYDGPQFDPVDATLLQAIDAKKQQPVDAVPTPFRAWNRCCRDEGGGVGIARGWHLIIAGNPGMGKSVLALNIAAHGVREGEQVGLISLEMSQMQAVTRFMSIFSGVKIRLIEHGEGYSSDAAFEAQSIITEAKQRSGGELLVNRKQISKLSDIAGAMRYLHDVLGVRYFITDYMQLAWTGNATNLLDRVTEVSHTVRQMSTDLNVVSIGLSQFNRSTSSAKETPTVQGLMGGSPLENDGEQVLMIDHSRYVKTRGRMGCDAMVPLILGKNRHGPTGEFAIEWDYSTLRATETEMSRLQKVLDSQEA